jgi:hypothetical protein
MRSRTANYENKSRVTPMPIIRSEKVIYGVEDMEAGFR